MARQTIKRILFALGLLTAFAGYSIDHSDYIPLATIFAPRYSIAMQTYENMIRDKKSIGPSDPGFAEIREVLSKHIGDNARPPIASIKITDWPWDDFLEVSKATEDIPAIAVEITYNDGRPSSTQHVVDLRQDIRKLYWEDQLFRWGFAIFIVGLIVSLIAFTWDTPEPKTT